MRQPGLAAVAVGASLATLALGACGGSPAPPHNTAPAEPSGRSYELGRGVQRDYRRAIAAYARECSDGRGDIAACDGWYRLNERLEIDVHGQDRAMVQALCERGGRYYCFLAVVRGMPATRAIEQRLMAQGKRCQANDQAACSAVLASISPRTEVDRLREIGIAVEHTPAQCKAGDAAACRIALTVYGIAHLASSRRSDEEEQVSEAGCAAGLLDACGEILDEALRSCPRLHAPRATCLDAVAADEGEDRVTAARLALRKLSAACSEGDADACRHVPGRAVPFCDLCEAGDAAACGGTVRSGSRCREIDPGALGAMTGFKDRMCACADAACGDQVITDLAKWSSAVVGLTGDGADGPADPAATAVMSELAVCLQKLH